MPVLLRRAVIGLALLTALVVPGVASAHDGTVFTPTYTALPPTIDGTMTPGEWNVTASYGIRFGTIPATVYLEQTATMLYVGVVVNDLAPAADGSASLYALFDNTHDGLRDQGDDFWLDNLPGGQDFFYSEADSAGIDDTRPGGTADTVAAKTSISGAVTFEMRHPLCSGDSGHDICASGGDVMGMDFQYSPGTGGFYNAPGPSFADESSWADIQFATDTSPPAVLVTSPVAGATLSGTITATANATDDVGVAFVKFELFDGTNDVTYDMGTDSTAPYESPPFDTTTVPDTVGVDATVYATATDAAGNSTKLGNGVTITNAAPTGGALSGTVSTPSPLTNIDLTAAGLEDWAIWGTDRGASLTPTARKAGGTAIGALAYTPATVTSGARAFGGDPFNPLSFDWSDGGSPSSAIGATAGVTAPSAGTGLTFTVPADKTLRTLTVWTSTHFANANLTASLSDGSAGTFTAPLNAGAGSFPDKADNTPMATTLQYKAASAGQHLTVSVNETADGCGGCDDIVLHAVALAGGEASVTGVTANIDTGDANSVGMSGANDSIDEIPLRAFEPTPSGTTAAPINGLPINGLPINGLPINGLPINGLPINGLPINGLPINGLPINGLPINGLPINGLPINGLPLTTPGGWAAALANTTLAGLPLQTVTLQQVLALPDPPDISLGDLDLSASPLGKVTIGALLLGATPINGLALPSTAIDALLAWCKQASSVDTNCTATAIGNASLFALSLAGAPINGLPINGLPINGLPIDGLPINGLPINGLAASASPIADLPINGLDLGAIPINGLPTDAVLGDFPDGTFTVGQLLQILVASGRTVTLGDVIAMLIRRADVPWETLPPRLLSAFDSSRPELPVSIGFGVDGSGTGPATVTATVPAGFDAKPGTSSATGGRLFAAIPDPVVSGHTLTWTLPDVVYGIGYRLQFTALSGTDVGPAQITVTAAAGSATSSVAATSFNVDDSFEPNGSATSELTPVITPDTRVEQSAIASRGDIDFYKIPLPPAGTRLSVHLTNLAADYDLALYANTTATVRTSTTAGAPLQDGAVGDEAIDTQGNVNHQLTPTALQDVPDPGIPVVQVSPNRGTDDEDVGMVSPGGSGYAYIAVFGYNGASSPTPYSLRVTTDTPAALTCTARSFGHDGEGTAGAAPAIASLPSDLNTLVLVNEKRIGDTYGSASEDTVVTALGNLAADRSLGVSGAVVPVESLAQSDYDTWDSNPCDTSAANAIANAIADEIAAVKAARPTLKYVVFAGGDDQIPFFRVPDLSRIANESGFAGAFGRNEYYGALAGGNLLSDDPYLDTRPIPVGGRQVFVPDLIGGRLVEKPSQIAGAVSRFETSGGMLERSTAFVSGYDFVTDGSRLVQSRLDGSLGTTTRTLINDIWSKNDLFDAAFPAAGAAAINDWNGHYDNHQALAANGDQSDLITTDDLTGPHALSGGIFFTMGCHAGFQTSDAIVGATAPDHLDWAETFAGSGTAFVGNTGFGLGNTDSVAFSEELMSNLAGNLDGSLSIGEALARAKQAYYLGRTAFSSYDEKTLSEAELYGLPMYGVGVAPRAVGVATPPPAAPSDPVRGTSASSSPDQGALTALPATSAQVAQFDATPSFTQQSGPHGDYLTNAGLVQAPNYRPLQPYVTLPATRAGTVAHGVIVDGLTSSDLSPFNPANVRPTLDLTANEPEPQFADEAWPEKIPTLVTLDDANGVRQSLGLMTGQFFVDPTSHAGVERRWTHLSGRVTYSTSLDFVPPSIDSIDAFVSSGAVTFSGRFSDRTETGGLGTVAFAQVVYDSDNSGTWVALPLQLDAGTWSGGAAFDGTDVQFFVEACDVAGNCGYSSNKGRYFNALPLPPATGGALAIVPDRDPDAGAFYKGAVDVTATAGNGASVSVSVDGKPFVTPSAPIALTGEGAHVVHARASDGSEATRVFLIDGVAPTITHAVTPATPDGANGWYTTAPTVSFTCTDDVSGLAGGCASVVLGESPAVQHVSTTATDNAGNSATDTVDGLKVDLKDPDKPVITGIAAGIYGVASVPAASAIGCTSADSASGVQSCVVTGYGSALGSHTLVATATDNAGRQSTASLTYVVGYVVGDILPPATAPNNDQTSPTANDLQVFKIKSTIPVKFRMYLNAAKTTLLTSPPAGSSAKLTFGRYSTSTSSTDTAALISAAADSGNLFRWTGSPDNQFIYNLSTAGLSAGTYYVTITLFAANGTTILAQSAKQYFILRA